jgi:hypothetical protein
MRPFSLIPQDDTMYYVLYDLRKDVDPSALANIHLPTAKCEGPVLLLVEPEDYESVRESLLEMCANEGNQWMSTILVRPEDAPTNTGDLEVNSIYVMIVHLNLFVEEPVEFMQKLKGMKRLVFH